MKVWCVLCDGGSKMWKERKREWEWWISIIKVKRAFFRHDRRTAPKFGTHVRIYTLTIKKLIIWPSPPQGGLGGYLLCGDDVFGMMFVCGMMMFVGCGWLFPIRPSDRAQIWHACADRYSHLKKFDPPQAGLGGYLLLKIVRDKCDHSYPWWVATGLSRAGRFGR